MNIQQQIDQLREARRLLEQLLESPGWKALERILDEQIQARTNSILLNPLESLDGAMKQEYEKGEVAGLRLFKQMPADVIDSYTHEIENLMVEATNEGEPE